MNNASTISLRIAHERALAEEWALVLEAEGLSPSVRQMRNGFVLGVPAEEAERATTALSAYEKENPAKPHDEGKLVESAHLPSGLAIAGALLAFFFFTGPWNSAARWFERGSADAERILLGELWRTVTALTLHADLVHAVTNAIACALFISAVCGVLGPGLGVVLVLLAGAGGNFLNALLHGSLHISVGASTSIFGAVGVLGGLGVVRRRLRGVRGRRAWVPIAAGFALLAMLGTGGQRVDLWAHLFGFLTGGVLGVLVAFAVPHPPGPRIQWTLGSAALVLVIYSWIFALR